MQNMETKSKQLEKAIKEMEQAKARLAEAKAKESERLRKEDTHRKIVMGGIVKKYLPDCAMYEEAELVKIISSAMDSAECRKAVEEVKKSAGYGTKTEKEEVKNEVG